MSLIVGGIHDRMPVMLHAEDFDRWLDPQAQTDELLALLRPYDPALMEAYAVDRAANNVRTTTSSASSPSVSPFLA